jgi:hypothetical protein
VANQSATLFEDRLNFFGQKLKTASWRKQKIMDPRENEKYCNECDETKSGWEFDLHSRSPDGLRIHCISCQRAIDEEVQGYFSDEEEDQEEERAFELLDALIEVFRQAGESGGRVVGISFSQNNSEQKLG